MVKTRSGKTTSPKRPVPNLPLNIQRLIFGMAARSGPGQRAKIAQVSRLGRNTVIHKMAADKINRARRKMIQEAYFNYLHNNIPKRFGTMAARMGTNVVGRMYTQRENIKRNFKNRILPRAPNNVNNGTRYYYNNQSTYTLNNRNILRRTYHTGPGAARVEQYIGKI
jgi:hypothetical protein